MACSREFAGQGGTCPHDGNMLVPLPQDPYVGRRIADKYHVLSVLGTGGMGVVYLARHETMQCNVAIKMLRAQFVGDQTSVRRFTQEAIACRRLHHENVITTYDHGFTPQGQPYIVMDCLDGTALSDEIKKLKYISVDRVLHIFMQACDALDHAHKQGVIHRDLKPGNIMLINHNDDPDFVKVVDFGVAKIMPMNDQESQSLTQAGEVCGSPVYMSPEQCVGQPLDRRADVYSMGVVIYEALTGRLPLIGKNMVETMHKHLNEKPLPFQQVRPDLYIPEKLEAVVMRALQKQPEMRQQTMAILRQELDFCVPRPGQNPSLRSIGNASPGFEAEKKASWVVPAIGAAVGTIVVGGAAVFFLLQNKTPPPSAVTPANTAPTVTTTAPVTPGTASTSPTATTGDTALPAKSTGTVPSSSTTTAVVPAVPAVPVSTSLPNTASSSSIKSAAILPALTKPVIKPPVAHIVKPVAVRKPKIKVSKPVIAKSTKPAAKSSASENTRFDDLRSQLSRLRKN